MYLKDCIVKFYGASPTVNFREYPFVETYGIVVVLINNIGVIKGMFAGVYPETYLIGFAGTPISDRDYRLAIARNRSLQALQTS